MSLVINTPANRNAIKYGRNVQLMRVLWILLRPFFSYSPRICFGWRNFLLRAMGASVGHGVCVYGSATIYFPWNLTIGDFSSIGERAMIYNLGYIKLGAHVTISQGAHLCAGSHDYKDTRMTLLKPPITIEEGVWICADAFVGPGVIVREGAIVGARAVAIKDIGAWEIVAGNPARLVKYRKMQEDAT